MNNSNLGDSSMAVIPQPYPNVHVSKSTIAEPLLFLSSSDPITQYGGDIFLPLWLICSALHPNSGELMFRAQWFGLMQFWETSS
jgi:hypothetical protein